MKRVVVVAVDADADADRSRVILVGRSRCNASEGRSR